jgi:hypothetical protein
MSAYFFHDGQNELGPFTIDVLKKQRLSRSTPIRLKDTNNWMPAEKLAPLRELVLPEKTKRQKAILSLAQEKFFYLKQRQPKVLYAGLFCLPLLAGFAIFSDYRNKNVIKVASAIALKPQPIQHKTVSLPGSPVAVSETIVQEPKPVANDLSR